MNGMSRNKKLIFIIPSLFVVWSLYLFHLYGPFYLSRIDPEYVYLLNGLNCSILDFVRIGHVDHPGTPFQLITGLFIRIVYWAAGHGTVVDDVISRPEFYLGWSSFLLTMLTAGVTLWIGKVVIRNGGNFIDVLILQSSVFLNVILIDLPARYIPDRILLVYTLILVGLCVKYFYEEKYTSRKFAVHSGILMGIGFITKFNFLPILDYSFFSYPKDKR